MDKGQITNNIQRNPIETEQFRVVTFQVNQMTQIVPNALPNISALNIRQINFLQNLGNYNKVKILCDNQSCINLCHSSKIFRVLGINEQGEDNLLMTASQEEVHCDSRGYMLVYRANNIIFGTLGYQINPRYDTCTCCEGPGCECTCCLCNCCTNCCKGGGCCLGGCCVEQGCCCCCEDGCCIGGCCTFCNCCCFDGGCCREPCWKNGCLPCPNFEKILLDVRFLNSLEEALRINAGYYVTTLFTPFDCCGISPKYFAYKKCGEKFGLENKCAPYCDTELNIIDSEKKEAVGKVKQNKTFCCDVREFDVDFPETALPLEKFLIISEIFMYTCVKWDLKLKNDLIITKKRKIYPGLEPNFI